MAVDFSSHLAYSCFAAVTPGGTAASIGQGCSVSGDFALMSGDACVITEKVLQLTDGVDTLLNSLQCKHVWVLSLKCYDSKVETPGLWLILPYQNIVLVPQIAWACVSSYTLHRREPICRSRSFLFDIQPHKFYQHHHTSHCSVGRHTSVVFQPESGLCQLTLQSLRTCFLVFL